MNKKINQILKNQITIIQTAFKDDGDKELRIEETRELLNPNFVEKFACDMDEVAKRGRGEKK